jgi:hypothetical protein
MSVDCDKGYDGDCCCNCKRQVKINCHPKNVKIGKDSITTTFAWGCEAFRGMKDDNFIIFRDTPHGVCEMHCRK